MANVKEVKEVAEVMEPVVESTVEAMEPVVAEAGGKLAAMTSNQPMIAVGVGFAAGIGTYLLATKVVVPNVQKVAGKVKANIEHRKATKELKAAKSEK